MRGRIRLPAFCCIHLGLFFLTISQTLATTASVESLQQVEVRKSFEALEITDYSSDVNLDAAGTVSSITIRLFERSGATDPETAQNCEWFWRERGFGVAESKSLCCRAATLDVNQKCINRACWGCCQLLSCDTACGIGDYLCFCGRTGYQCAYELDPDYPF